ncbi:MAG: FliH/SctL family protein [Bacillota bacterium]|nr:FliH/SctL family protein [Bacillota bacterium]
MKWWFEAAVPSGSPSQPVWPSLEEMFPGGKGKEPQDDPLLKEWEKGRQEGRRQGYQEGYAEGVRRGQEALQQAEVLKESLLQAERHLQGKFQQLAEELEKGALDWALALAQAVLRRELGDPGRAVLEEARRLLQEGEAEEVRVSPEDYEAIRDAWDFGIRLRPEDKVARGDLWLLKEGELQLWGASRRWRQLVALLEEELRRKEGEG